MAAAVPQTEAAAAETAETTHPHLLQGPTRFSQSLLWDLMRSFYERNGVDAWSKGIVPFFITCNAYIARCYARVVHGYLADLLHRGESDLAIHRRTSYYRTPLKL